MRNLVMLVIGILPASQVKNMLLRFLGHSVARDARLGPALYIQVGRLDVGAGSRVDAFNVFRCVDLLLLEKNVEVGSFNWFSSTRFLTARSTSPFAGHVVLREASSLTSRHFIEASGGFELGRYALMAGVRSTVMTHGVDVDENVMVTDQVQVGEYAMVGGNTALVLGSTVPARSVVAMGSTVIRGLTQQGMLYAGAPAVCKKRVGGSFFDRVVGPVPATRHGPGSAAAGE